MKPGPIRNRDAARETWADERTRMRERVLAGGGKPWEKMSLNYRSVCENFAWDFGRRWVVGNSCMVETLDILWAYLQIIPIPTRPVSPGYRPGGSHNPQ